MEDTTYFSVHEFIHRDKAVRDKLREMVKNGEADDLGKLEKGHRLYFEIKKSDRRMLIDLMKQYDEKNKTFQRS